MLLENFRERFPSSDRFARELIAEQGMSTYETNHALLPYDQILSPDKEPLFMLPGFGGIRESRAALETVATRYSVTEFGEPIENYRTQAGYRSQSESDSYAFEQFIRQELPEGQKSILVCPSFAALTGVELTLRNPDKVNHLMLLVPAGFRKRDNPISISYRYLREAVKVTIPTVKQKGRDGMKGSYLTAKKAVLDARGSLRRMSSVLKSRLPEQMDPLLTSEDIILTGIVGDEDGLFKPQDTEDSLKELMTRIKGLQTGDEGLIFSRTVDKRVHVRRRPGGHDLGCNGQPELYGKLIVEELDETMRRLFNSTGEV